jgi:predicted TPR repeat methyltransferase
LVYIFDLAPVAAAVARVLGPRGLFGFTVETHGGDGVELGERLRYRHGEGHVRAALASGGLSPVVLSPVTTRIEGAAAVAGLLVLASRLKSMMGNNNS